MGLCIAGMIASMAHRGNPRDYVPDIHPLPSYFLLFSSFFHLSRFSPGHVPRSPFYSAVFAHLRYASGTQPAASIEPYSVLEPSKVETFAGPYIPGLIRRVERVPVGLMPGDEISSQFVKRGTSNFGCLTSNAVCWIRGHFDKEHAKAS